MEQTAEKQKSALIGLTCSLVDIPTENLPPDGYEKGGQDFVKGFLSEMGCEVREYSPTQVPDFETNGEFLHDRHYEGRNNVIGVWKGTGGGRSLLLTGHMDVAPKEPLPWTVCDPYHSVVKGDRLYGRGSCDMKGGLACALIAMKTLKAGGFAPRGDVIFESVVDEEYAGATGTIASRMLGNNADFGIILEATGFNICPACVGGIILKVTVAGIPGMPYTGEEVDNPAYHLAEIIGLIKGYDHLRSGAAKRPPLWEKTPQSAQIIITKVKAGEVTPNGQLSTPLDGWIELVIQTYPGEEAEDVVKGFSDFLRGRFSRPEILTIETEYHYCRPASPGIPTRAVDILKDTSQKYTDRAIVCGSMLSCDLFAFELFGHMPGVVFGPIGEHMHGPDEYASISSLMTLTNILKDFIKVWCG
ncbi:MAG: M20/M25/M40 family metallo-hydrolase [Clostridia bacterium]|nr:M20/M25/M40 family metallo-hydrolase [Clostridia bacterium]